MNKLEKELVFNFIYQTNVKQDKKRIGEKNWRKIITKFFPQTFGIEVEINENCFGMNSDRLDNAIYEYIVNNSKLKNQYRLGSNCKQNNDSYKPYSIGWDGSSVEMRSFNTIDTIELLQRCNKKWLSHLTDTNFVSSLHIHIPISTKIYLQPKKQKKVKTNSLFLKSNIPDKSLFNDKSHEMYDFIISKEGIEFVKKYSILNDDCKLKSIIMVELGNTDGFTSCHHCLDCGWVDKFFNVDSLPNRRRTRKRKVTKNCEFKDYYVKYCNMINRLANSNIYYKKLANYIQSHQSEKEYGAYVDERSQLINIQSPFQTFEFRRMTTSNALTIDELLTKVLIVKAMEGFLNKYKTEQHLIEIIEFLQNDLSINI